jgi:hypothetical protein
MSPAKGLSTLLSEVERQEKYLAGLPPEFKFPLFNGRLAVESQRKSGYKDTARAAREIVDNAFEAGAKTVWITMDRAGAGQRGKRERRDAVANLAFIDDGPGMLPRMIRAALAWGGGTHGKEPGRIGRFGFGLPNSSINQTRRVEVYSKTAGAKGWTMAALDINDGRVPEHGMVFIAEEQPDVALPGFVEAYLKKKSVTLKSGTVVVWVRPDRLTYQTAGMLANLLQEDFGATYRYLLNDFTLIVDDQPTIKVDPLFLMKDALFYRAPEDKGAEPKIEKALAVSYSRDEETGAQQLDLLATKEELQEARKNAHATVGTIKIRIARFPYGFAVGGKNPPRSQWIDEHAKKRFAIRKPRRGMSFVRGGREIDTVHFFPTDNGLGDWPLLQSYAYHWGVEVSFEAALDEAFGVGHDKQSVRPIEDFWRVLHQAKVDELLRFEEQHQDAIRHEARENAAEESLKNVNDSGAMQAAAIASEVIGKAPIPTDEQEKVREAVQQEVRERAEREALPEDEVARAVEAEATQKPFRVEYYEAEGGPFFKPDRGNGLQTVALINKKHPFFGDFYAELVLAKNAKAVGAINLLLVGMAEYELGATDSTRLVLQHLREGRLSPFLKVALQHLSDIEPAPDQENESAGSRTDRDDEAA